MLRRGLRGRIGRAAARDPSPLDRLGGVSVSSRPGPGRGIRSPANTLSFPSSSGDPGNGWPGSADGTSACRKTHSGPPALLISRITFSVVKFGAADAFEDITKQLLHVGLLRRHARDDDGLTVRISAVGARVARRRS